MTTLRSSWPRGIVYAHRGASLEYPENTLPAFERALALGADAIETDAHITRDGHVVLSHDPTGMRMAGRPELIRDVTLETVRSWDAGRMFVARDGGSPFRDKGMTFPTLDEALTAFPRVRFNLDAKQAGTAMVQATLRVLRAHRAQDRVRLASFHVRNLIEIRRAGWEGETGMAPAEVLFAYGVGHLGRFARPAVGWLGHAAQIPTRAGGIALDTAGAIARFHSLGLRVDFWTINDPAQAIELLARGADGVMTDDPAAVIPVVRSARTAR